MTTPEAGEQALDLFGSAMAVAACPPNADAARLGVDAAGVRERMRAAIDGDGPVDARTAVLCTLAGALGWDRLVFPDVLAARLQQRPADLRGADGIVADLEAVVMAAAVLPAATT
ncbi:hypothetical protein J2S43_002056 [Catenuloplanes nepalensis]|uniref:Uncharacterized protein n=1 Tax=Catenuloplanes nepalensis TaxID=587533 RepID=A0ABT9MQ44_9ACTN|nr:GPP34 family phosphoprotein [Catenuloplanes nepalensis]MDP9793544.1 hypothetical protein [Catenuloplanes nepalensis]